MAGSKRQQLTESDCKLHDPRTENATATPRVPLPERGVRLRVTDGRRPGEKAMGGGLQLLPRLVLGLHEQKGT